MGIPIVALVRGLTRYLIAVPILTLQRIEGKDVEPYLRSALSAQAEPNQEFKRLITTEGMKRRQRLGTRIK